MNDLRHALQQLLRDPGFTFVAVLALALGIGVNSVMFSLVDAVLFRPLPMAKPEQLIRIGMTDERGVDLGGVSYPLLQDLAREADSLSGLAGTSDGSEVNLSVGDEAVERVTASNVSGNFFSVLGVAPAAGRLLGPGDDLTPGGHPVIVLSEAFWRRRFGADAQVVGSTVRMNTRIFTIVGVAARGFLGASLQNVPDLWMPLTMAAEASPNVAQFKPFERRGFTWVSLIGRLKEGASPATAVAQLNTINARINTELKISTEGDRYDRFRALPLSGATLDPGRQEAAVRSSRILIGVTGLVMVIACAVAAGLLMVRGERRQRELAVRAAIGASRSRIVWQLLSESFLLSAAAGALGIFLAQWGAEIFLRLTPATIPLPISAAAPILESRVLWFTSGLAVVSAFVFGLLPAWRASHVNLVSGMRLGGGVLSAQPRSFPWRNGIVVLQVALSAVLLVGAGLLLRTLGAATRVDLGFDPEHALVVSLDVSKSGYDRAKGRQFYRDVLEGTRRLPGVRSAAISRHVPIQGAAMISSVELTNFTPPAGREPRVMFTPASADFFRTMGIPIEQGREFARADDSGPSILMVNRAFADRFWPGRDALRERVLNFGERGAQVIGVAANVKQVSVRETPEPMIYVPDWAFYMPSTSLVVRTTGDSRAALPAVTGLIRRLDKNVPVFGARTLRQHVGQALAEERVTAALLSTFGLMALILAALGLYGVIAFTTQIRSPEFGIRLALGASPRALLALVLRHGAGLAMIGVVIGLTAAAAGSRVLGSMLFGVGPTDRPTFIATAALLLLVALAASAIPARRAARVDPLRTLRSE